MITTFLAERALVLVVSGPLADDPPGTLEQALTAAAGTDAPPLFVLDLRNAAPFPAHAGRPLVEFARARAEAGVRCVLLADPGSHATRTALDAADPQRAVPRADSLEQALSGASPVPGAPTPPPPQVIQTTDVEEAEQFLSQSYAKLRIHSRGGQSGLRAASATIGAARLDRLDFRMTFEAEVEPMGRFVFVQVRSGGIAFRSARGERRYRAGDVFLAAQPDDAHHSTLENSSFTVAVLDPALMTQVAQNEPGWQAPVRFTGYDPVSPKAAAAWQTMCTLLHDHALANPEALEHTLVTSNAARLLAAVAVTSFPNTALTEPTIEDRHDAHPGTLRRAVAFIEANADRDITVADIADAAYVTIRAIQLAFRRYLDTTPTAYLRRVRLDHARAELACAVPGRDTVTRVAARWGYSRANVFAAHYRAVYGELPSQTLRRLRPP